MHYLGNFSCFQIVIAAKTNSQSLFKQIKPEHLPRVILEASKIRKSILIYRDFVIDDKAFPLMLLAEPDPIKPFLMLSRKTLPIFKEPENQIVI